MVLPTSLTAHIRAIEPILFVIVTRVAFARSSLLTSMRFSLLIMLPKLQKEGNEIKGYILFTVIS